MNMDDASIPQVYLQQPRVNECFSITVRVRLTGKKSSKAIDLYNDGK
jgi:hypothetical protein